MRELQNNALPQSPQENFYLVAHLLSTLVLFLTGGDGSFPGTKTTFMLGVFFLTITTRNKENIWSHSKPKETYCLRRPSHWKSFLIKTTAVVELSRHILLMLFWKSMHIFVANLFKRNFCNHLITAAFMLISLLYWSVWGFSCAVSGFSQVFIVTTQSPHARKNLWYPGYPPSRAFVTIGSPIFSLKSSSEIFRGCGYAFAG